MSLFVTQESRDFFDLSFWLLLFYTPNVHDTMLELTTTAVNIKSSKSRELLSFSLLQLQGETPMRYIL
jgi:hypothetical protein